MHRCVNIYVQECDVKMVDMNCVLKGMGGTKRKWKDTPNCLFLPEVCDVFSVERSRENKNYDAREDLHVGHDTSVRHYHKCGQVGGDYILTAGSNNKSKWCHINFRHLFK